MGPDVVQAVSRLTYGPAPGDLAAVAAMGVAAFVAEQLAPEAIEEPTALAEALEKLPTQSMDTVRLFREYGPPADAAAVAAAGGRPGADTMRQVFDRAELVALEAAKARLCRAILSKRQLAELMVAFWCEHFSLGAPKGLAQLWQGSFEREAIRPNALGKFADLLAATARHPAMLIARGNWKNVVHRETAGGKGEAIDPAYAAVLIHQTLGPGGPQKPADTLALARILTGWRAGAARGAADTGGFYFDVDLHDPSDKTLLGHPVKGTGLAEGAAALDILAAHPATARNIARKLAVYFLADEPPAPLVARLAETFAKTGGDIRETLRTLFAGPEFFDPKYLGNRFKSPLRQVVSAVRAAGGGAADATALAGVLDGLGQPFYAAGGPEGYPVAAGPWLKPDALVRRVSFAGDLAAGRIPGLGLSAGKISRDALAATLGPTVGEDTLQTAAKAPAAVGAAVILAAPEAMRY
ncbi:MAG: DUF1800 domain-containing protein [Solidesulfovibrio sp. DCME]|uniref:DUF1800 domain-containing protein n=1 Tax=Solidesulfovibrio sp. DCME TaxID=3447380 RepID=UPI003D123D43